MSMFGQVYVKNNQYKIKGDFHHLEQHMPIRDADDGWRLMGVTNPRDMTYIHSYGGEALFFESLSQGQAAWRPGATTRNAKTKGSIYQPFRIHCPDCLSKEHGHRHDRPRARKRRRSTPSWCASDRAPSTCWISRSSSSTSSSTAYARF